MVLFSEDSGSVWRIGSAISRMGLICATERAIPARAVPGKAGAIPARAADRSKGAAV